MNANRHGKGETLDLDVLVSRILNTTKDAFWIINSKGHFEKVNQSYVNMTGYSRDELTGMHINDIDHIESDADTSNRMK